MKRIIVGVSGGPDSMALLNKLYRKHKYELLVAHVNYHLRENSDQDQKLLEKYCRQRKIFYRILNVTNEIWEKYHYLKNKQFIARKIRYDFFLKLSNDYHIEQLFLAHQKDDFIETAIMQEGRSKDLLFYGIRKKSNYGSLIIKRPFLKRYYKDDLIEYCQKKTINFIVDQTNFLPIYERNRIRLNLSEKTIKEKETYYKYYLKINKSHQKFDKKIAKIFEIWKKNEFSYPFFNYVENKYKFYLIYRLLIESYYFVAINSNKICGVLAFLDNNPSTKKGYRLSEGIFMCIEKEKIKIKEL